MRATAKIIQIETKRKTKRGGGGKKQQNGIAIGKGLSDRSMKALSERFADPRTEGEHREAALFAVLSTTGLRAKEILNLKFSDRIELPEGEVVFKYIRKGGATCFTVIPERTLEAVRRYHETAKIQSDRFFLTLPVNRTGGRRQHMTTRNLQRIVNGWEATTGRGKTAHPHAFRHTVGQKIFDSFGSMEAQKKLGHASPTVTSKYYTRPFFDGSSSLDWK